MKSISVIIQKLHELFADSQKKRVFIAITILAVAIGSIIVIRLMKPKTDEILNKIYDLDKPILVEIDEQFAYLKATGEHLLEGNFLYASPFYGEYAAVSKEENKYEIIDKTGNTHFTANEQPKYYKDYGVWQIENSLYDSHLKVLFEGDYKLSYIDDGYFIFLDNANPNSGIVDYTGKKTFELSSNYINASISHSQVLSNTYAIISDYEDRECIVNLKNGKIVFELEDTSTKYIRESDDNIFKIINRSNNYKTEEWLYIEDDKIAFDTKESIYDISFFDIQNRVLMIDYGPGYKNYGHKIQQTYYLINGKKFDENYKSDEKDSNEIKIERTYKISKNKVGEYYELHKNGSRVLENAYSSITFLDLNLFRYLKTTSKMEPVLLTSGNTTYLYDIKKGKTLKEFKTANVENPKDSTFFLGTVYKSDGFTKETYEVYNIMTNANLEVQASSQVKIYSNYLTVKDGNKTTYYNSSLEKIFET